MGEPQNIKNEQMDIDEDFKFQFYNLQGTHIKERKKNFYKLLSSVSLDLPEDQIDIQPRNYQEKIFYVDVLIHLRQVKKLTEILKEGIGVLTSRILKQKWFFQEAFKEMGEEEIVKKFLPSLPHSLKMKVLKKLSLTLSEERMDTIFDLVLERYGLFIAKQFLFSCSSQKIIHVLQNYEITLLSEQLKRILQKDIGLLEVYFEEYKKNTGNDFNDTAFLTYLAWKHPNLYFKLGLSRNNLKLGRYTTRAIIRTNKEEVLKDVENSSWNKAALVREVKEFDKDYLFLLLPAYLVSRHSFGVKVVSYLRKYPIKKRWTVLAQAFKQAYKEEIVDNLDKFDETLAVFFPREIQEKWAEVKYFETDSLSYIKYFNPTKAFKLLKDKINVTSDINQRGNLLNELITVCLKNEDYSTFEAVLKYISLRHRNDDRNVRSNMVSYIERYIKYDHLTETHWKYINEIIDIQRVRDESLPFTIMAEYLLFMYLKKHPLDEPVSQYLKDCIKSSRSFRLLPWWKEVEGYLLKHFVKILPTLKLKDEPEYYCNIMRCIIDFNREIKGDKNKDLIKLLIDLNEITPLVDLSRKVGTKLKPYDYNDYNIVENLILYNCLCPENPIKVINEDGLLALIKDMSTDNRDRFSKSILRGIQKPKRTQFENKLLEYYFDNCHLGPSAIKYFLTNEPEVIAKYFSKILAFDTEVSYNMLNYDIIKKYSHLEFDNQLILRFKDLVSINSKYDRKLKILNALSRVMNTKDFLSLVEEYTPAAKKLDLENKEQREIYQLQCDIAKLFKRLDEPSSLAPVIMHFSQGDYLQSSLPALYRVLYRISEDKVFSYVKDLGERAVSARKHAVFLSFEVLAVEDAMTLYSELSKKETNTSAKKYIFNAVLKYFLKIRSETLLNIVFVNMEFVDKNDTELIQTVIESVNDIPNKYKPLFVEKVWHFLYILEQQDVKVFDYRSSVLNNIYNWGVSFIYRLNKEFCENLIKTYFLSIKDDLRPLADVNYFVINYLLAYLDEQHFEFIFNIIKCYKNTYWKSRVEMKNVFKFFSNIYDRFQENDVKFLYLFDKCWQNLFYCEECFSEFILLKLMILYKETLNIEDFSKRVNTLFEEQIQRCGPYISEFLIDSVKTFFSTISHKSGDMFNLRNFALWLLASNSYDFNYYVAYRIGKNLGSREEEKQVYSKILNILKPTRSESSAAEIYFNNMLLKRS